ncbi:MAG: FecR domain-containing protein [Bacteroidota bacterium]
MTETEFAQLLQKYANGFLSDMERVELESWYIHQAEAGGQEMTRAQVVHGIAGLRKRLPLVYAGTPKKLWPKIAAAASILLVFAAGLYLYTSKQAVPHLSNQTPYTQDIAPGRNAATLTLASGRKIELSSIPVGNIVKTDGVSITKNEQGRLVYQIAADAGSGTKYNTISTSNGEQVQIVLADGSAVWLNAASSLQFPTLFSNTKSREVKLSGEGYFEVAKNKHLPFIVHTANHDVKVLGTHFNISSYTDEAFAKTTLSEGSVQINNGILLKPGEQANVSSAGIKVIQVDTELALGWKNNKFMFEDQGIEEIMKMVARWYNVEVVYEGKKPTGLFTGAVPRFENLSKLLDILQLTNNVHFKVSGRRITVMQ